MKKILISSIFVLFLVAAFISAVSAIRPDWSACNGNAGSIWTTRDDCGDEIQDVNSYAIGEKVFINGKNFCQGNYNWSITGQPGGASEDPGIVVALGSKVVDTAAGLFCFEAYTIQADDGGEYKVLFGGKHDNYRVDIDAPVIPEFGFYAGALALLGAVGVFFLVRRK